MSVRRKLHVLPVARGTAALDALPALERALVGEGPALLPTADDPPPGLGVGEPLDDGEDAPGDPTTLVVTTSGSTGTPKGVLLPASALRASANATHQRLGGPGHWLLAMPAHHIAGVQVLIRSVIAGTRPHAVDTTGGFRPEPFADAAEAVLRTDGPHYTALVPTQLSRLLGNATGLAALRAFDAVLIGGAAAPPTLLRAARDAEVRVVTTYGMSETSGGCVYDGIPLTGTRVSIDDTGLISLSGPTLARGYRRSTAAAFADGWYHTGDLGRWTDGRLEVLGRADDMIITGGVNVAPALVERVLTGQGGVRDACVVGIDDAEWGQAVVAAVVADSPPPSVTELRSAVRARVGAAATPKEIVFVPELPLRGPGKPDRRALREALNG